MTDQKRRSIIADEDEFGWDDDADDGVRMLGLALIIGGCIFLSLMLIIWFLF